MTIRRITTEQAPSAKPVSKSVAITTSWQLVADAPEYDVPVVGFGTERRIAPGVAEISSPLLVSNVGASSATVSVRLVRYAQPLIADQTETDFGTFTGGTSYAENDVVTLSNDSQVLITGVTGGVVTEFDFTSVGSDVPAGTQLTQINNTGSGTGFTVDVEAANLVPQIFLFASEYPVEPQDTVIIPLNGQFLLTGDRLEVQGSAADTLNATISFTEGQSEEDDIFIDSPEI